VGSHPTEDNVFLRVIKIDSMTSFEGEVKPSVLCQRFYGMLKKPASMKEILRRQNSTAFSHQVSPVSLLMSPLIIAKELW
jgi:hypothetical protein